MPEKTPRDHQEPQPAQAQQPSVVHKGPHRWLPGQSGNPRGRPKAGATFKEIIAFEMAQSFDGTDKSTKQAIVQKVVELAKQGREWAIQWLADRLEGKTAVPLEIGKKSNPLEGISDEEITQALEIIKASRAVKEIGHEPGQPEAQ